MSATDFITQCASVDDFLQSDFCDTTWGEYIIEYKLITQHKEKKRDTIYKEITRE